MAHADGCAIEVINFGSSPGLDILEHGRAVGGTLWNYQGQQGIFDIVDSARSKAEIALQLNEPDRLIGNVRNQVPGAGVAKQFPVGHSGQCT
jgi:hypothetical protein